jgi:hypothetical protein
MKGMIIIHLSFYFLFFPRYGDYVPTTTIGRSIVIVGAGFGLVLTALIITVVHKRMQLSMKESRVCKFRGIQRHSEAFRGIQRHSEACIS